MCKHFTYFSTFNNLCETEPAKNTNLCILCVILILFRAAVFEMGKRKVFIYIQEHVIIIKQNLKDSYKQPTNHL